MRCRNARLATGSRESPKASLHHTPKVEPDVVDRNTLRAGSRPAGAGLTMAGLRGKPLIAYLVVCVFWGSTYLAIRVGVGVLPPFLFAGTALLVGAAPAQILHADLRGPIALTLASASWSLGSVYAKRHPTEASPYVGAALQMIVGGGAVALVGFALGEWSAWHLTPRGLGAIAYLVVFGSILGYSAYTYALRHASPTIVGTYAYVNPVIAVLLGWLILREPVTARTFVAMAMILGAVVWIQFSHK